MFKKLFTSRSFLENWLASVRVVTGILIAIVGFEVFDKGRMNGNVAWLTDLHFPVPHFMAYLGKAAELIGGIFLALGLLVRLMSVILVVDMFVITFIMGQGKILGDAQLPFVFLLLFAGFFFAGSGKWSLDYLLFDRKKDLV
jgi:putative oxidoreductase